MGSLHVEFTVISGKLGHQLLTINKMRWYTTVRNYDKLIGSIA